MDMEDLKIALIDLLRVAVERDMDGIYLHRNKIKAALLVLENCPECAEVHAIGKEWGVDGMTASGVAAKLAVRSLPPPTEDTE